MKAKVSGTKKKINGTTFLLMITNNLSESLSQ